MVINIEGGEPLLRPDIEDIGREIRKRGFGWTPFHSDAGVRIEDNGIISEEYGKA